MSSRRHGPGTVCVPSGRCAPPPCNTSNAMGRRPLSEIKLQQLRPLPDKGVVNLAAPKRLEAHPSVHVVGSTSLLRVPKFAAACFLTHSPPSENRGVRRHRRASFLKELRRPSIWALPRIDLVTFHLDMR